MNRTAVEYAKKSILKNGKEKALRIATDCEKSAQYAGAITFFNEADFSINQNGQYEFSKSQSGKFDGNKIRRVKSTINFWKDVVIAINKGQI